MLNFHVNCGLLTLLSHCTWSFFKFLNSKYEIRFKTKKIKRSRFFSNYPFFHAALFEYTFIAPNCFCVRNRIIAIKTFYPNFSGFNGDVNQMFF